MITSKIEQDAGDYHAWSPELPGCHTHGHTRAEALSNLKDAVRLYLDDVTEEELPTDSRKSSKARPRRKASAA
ncbi:MAG TPA: type II toxin-antitoxin system HicB family antitoxin [Rhizomicrobium sp.]|nr:type II toxin-antitoxin system HicB family antitoxin [Rhizomicrobium sp.]